MSLLNCMSNRILSRLNKIFILLFVTMNIFISDKSYAAEVHHSKVLIAYYSKSGNTRAIANLIQKKTGGDIYEIKPKIAYTRERPEAADIPKHERESGELPELQGNMPDLSSYDTIIIGTPIWWYTLSTPVMSFLKQVDLKGKTVAGFYTYAGDAHNFDKDLKDQVKNAVVLESIGFRGTYDNGWGDEPDGDEYQQEHIDDTEGELNTWLNKISTMK